MYFYPSKTGDLNTRYVWFDFGKEYLHTYIQPISTRPDRVEYSLGQV